MQLILTFAFAFIAGIIWASVNPTGFAAQVKRIVVVAIAAAVSAAVGFVMVYFLGMGIGVPLLVWGAMIGLIAIGLRLGGLIRRSVHTGM